MEWECDNRRCRLDGERNAETVLLHLADAGEQARSTALHAEIAARTDVPFLLVSVPISDWNRELSPWEAPPVFGSKPFGSGAGETLSFFTDALLPGLSSEAHGKTFVLGGYSLAGLFALWAAYQTDAFWGVAAVSPSVWFPGWTDRTAAYRPRTAHIYLSLGEREAHTKNAVMRRVADCIRLEHERLLADGVDSILEWNEGNHFQDVTARTAKGFAWLLRRLKTEREEV